ncbi:MAG: hypothetical protein ACYDD1_16410 [Caulobacteraceae bacterium]
MSFSILFVAAFVAAGSPPSSTPDAPSPMPQQVASAKPVDDGDKVLCKTTAETGSHFSSKVCRPKRDWLAMQKAGKDTADDFQQRSSSMSLNGK